jgi:hypothetical protein
VSFAGYTEAQKAATEAAGAAIYSWADFLKLVSFLVAFLTSFFCFDCNIVTGFSFYSSVGLTYLFVLTSRERRTQWT